MHTTAFTSKASLRESLTAIAAVVALAACTSQAVKSPGAIETPSRAAAIVPTTAGSATPHPGKAAIITYTNLWHAYALAVQHPDPAAKSLRPYATDNALKIFENGLAQLKQQGLVGRGDVVLAAPTVVSATATGIKLSGCVDTAGTHLYKADGSAYHDSPGGKRLCTVELTDVDGTWKASEWALQAVGTC